MSKKVGPLALILLSALAALAADVGGKWSYEPGDAEGPVTEVS